MYEHLKSQTLPELTATLKELGQSAFRGKQVYTWLHKGVRQRAPYPYDIRDIQEWSRYWHSA